MLVEVDTVLQSGVEPGILVLVVLRFGVWAGILARVVVGSEIWGEMFVGGGYGVSVEVLVEADFGVWAGMLTGVVEFGKGVLFEVVVEVVVEAEPLMGALFEVLGFEALAVVEIVAEVGDFV